jgi:hypothetical protein
MTRRALLVGVFGGLLVGTNPAEELGDAPRVGFIVRLEFLAGDFSQLGDEAAVFRKPFVLLRLGALAVAGVGEETGPLRRKFGGVSAIGREDSADLPELGCAGPAGR